MENVRLVCQIIIGLLVVIRFLVLVYFDFEGRPASSPTGFSGFVASILVSATTAIVLYFAGAFSCLF